VCLPCRAVLGGLLPLRCATPSAEGSALPPDWVRASTDERLRSTPRAFPRPMGTRLRRRPGVSCIEPPAGDGSGGERVEVGGFEGEPVATHPVAAAAEAGASPVPRSRDDVGRFRRVAGQGPQHRLHGRRAPGLGQCRARRRGARLTAPIPVRCPPELLRRSGGEPERTSAPYRRGSGAQSSTAAAPRLARKRPLLPLTALLPMSSRMRRCPSGRPACVTPPRMTPTRIGPLSLRYRPPQRSQGQGCDGCCCTDRVRCSGL
jgi:hypothetical protein